MNQNGFLARPAVSDGAYYRLEALDALREIEDGGVPAFFTGMWTNRWRIHPPLFSRVAAVIALPVGEITPGVCWLTSALFGIVLSFGAYCLARSFVRPWYAVLAVAVTQSAPAVIENWNPFFPQLATCALAVWSWVFLLRSSLLRRHHLTFVAGLLAAVALLTKIVAPLYLVGAVVAAVALRVRQDRRVVPALRDLVVLALPPALLALPWYVGHRTAVMAQADYVSDEMQVLGHDTAPLFSFERWSYYPRAMAEHGFGPALGLLVSVATVTVAVRAIMRSRSSADGCRRQAVVILAVAAIVAWIMTSCRSLANSSFYLLAFLPAGAICVSALVSTLGGRTRRVVVGVVLAACGWNQLMCLRLVPDDHAIGVIAGVEIGGRKHRWLGLPAVAAACSARPSAEDWPNAEFVDLIASRTDRPLPEVLVATRERLPHPWVYPATLIYEARLRDVNLRVSGYRSSEHDLPALLRGVDFVILDETFLPRDQALKLISSTGARPELIAIREVTRVSTVSLIAVRH